MATRKARRQGRVGSGTKGSPGSRMRMRRLRRDPNALAVVAAVAKSRDLPAFDILQRPRGEAEVAAARQLVMYLVHVLLGRRQEEVGLLFGRERTTVSYACRMMEERRDCPEVEAEIISIERRLSLTASLANSMGAGHAA